MVYIFPIILTLFLMYHYDYRKHKKGRKAWYLFLMVYCILVAGLRYHIGGDTMLYMSSYKDLPNLSKFSSFDFDSVRYGRGYLFVNAIARSISDNFVVMQMILAIVVNTVVFRFFYLNTYNIFTAVLLYLFLSYLNLNTEVLRESVAIACLLIGWEFFYKHKWGAYYLVCGIAFLFHPSSLFMLILPIFNLKIFNKIFSVTWVALIFAFGCYGLGIYLTDRFFELIRLIGFATLDGYADIYENSGLSDAKNFNIIGRLLDILMYIVYPLILGYLLQLKYKKNESKHRYVKSLIIMVMLYAYIGALSSSMIILYRFLNYLTLFFILCFSDIVLDGIRLFKKKYRLSYSINVVLIGIYIFTPTNRLFKASGAIQTAFIHRYYPYYSVINPKLDPEREKINYYYQNR